MPCGTCSRIPCKECWRPNLTRISATSSMTKPARIGRGNKDVLGMWIDETESFKFWLTVLNDLRNRGVQDILIISIDNLTGFSEAIVACYPDAEIKKCIVHQIRNSIKYVSYKDVKKITSALKPRSTRHPRKRPH